MRRQSQLLVWNFSARDWPSLQYVYLENSHYQAADSGPDLRFLELLVQGKPRRYAPLHRSAVLSDLQAKSKGFIGRARKSIRGEFCFLRAGWRKKLRLWSIDFVPNPPVKICEWQQVLYHRTEAKKRGFYENMGFGKEISPKKPRFWDILRTIGVNLRLKPVRNLAVNPV